MVLSESSEQGPTRSGGLVFDFDGTLVDSSDIKQRAFVTALEAEISVPATAVDDAYRAYGTLNRVPQLSNAFRQIVGRRPDDSELENLVSIYGSFVHAHHHEVRVFDGIREFLASHRSRFFLAVASNAPQDELLAACRTLAIDKYFDRIYGYPISKEEAIETVRSDWGLPPSRIIYIGDRPEDGSVAEHVGVAFCRFGPLELVDGEDLVRSVTDLEQVLASVVPA